MRRHEWNGTNKYFCTLNSRYMPLYLTELRPTEKGRSEAALLQTTIPV